MSIAKHITLAQTNGPAAGMKAFLAAPVSRRSPHYAEITSAPKREQLARYCNIYGPFETPQAEPVVEVKKGKKQAEIDALKARIAELEGKQVRQPARRTTTREEAKHVIVAKRISFPMAMALKKCAKKDKVKFEITGKTGEGYAADYAVKYAGKTLKPQEASEIIGFHKSQSK